MKNPKCRHLYAICEDGWVDTVQKTAKGYRIQEFMTRPMPPLKDQMGIITGYKFKHCPKCGVRLG